MSKILVHALKLWNGRQQLSIAFWGVFVPVFIAGRLFKLGIKSSGLEDNLLIASMGLILILAAKMFSMVAVWRCAPNVKVKDSPLPVLARGVVVLSLLPFAVLLLALVAAAFGA